MALDKTDPFPQLPRRSLFAGSDVTKPVTKPSDVTKPRVGTIGHVDSSKAALAGAIGRILAGADKPTLADKPLGGRPPAGDRAMTAAERKRRSREAKAGK